MQQFYHPAQVERPPPQLPLLRPLPSSCGEEELVFLEVPHHGQRRTQLLEALEGQPDRRLHGFIRIEDDLPRGIVDEPGRQLQAQGPLPGLRQQAPLQAEAQPV